MKVKQIFLDTETTGVDPTKHGLISFGGVIRVGEGVERFDAYVQPFPADIIDPKALEVNKLSKEELNSYDAPKRIYREFLKLLERYVDKYNKLDKFFLYGWNVGFDDQFLRAFFKKLGDKYYGSFFAWPAIDVAVLAAEQLGQERLSLPNFQLDSVAEHLGLTVDHLERHSALYDAELAMLVYDRLKSSTE